MYRSAAPIAHSCSHRGGQFRDDGESGLVQQLPGPAALNFPARGLGDGSLLDRHLFFVHQQGRDTRRPVKIVKSQPSGDKQRRPLGGVAPAALAAVEQSTVMSVAPSREACNLRNRQEALPKKERPLERQHDVTEPPANPRYNNPKPARKVNSNFPQNLAGHILQRPQQPWKGCTQATTTHKPGGVAPLGDNGPSNGLEPLVQNVLVVLCALPHLQDDLRVRQTTPHGGHRHGHAHGHGHGHADDTTMARSAR